VLDEPIVALVLNLLVQSLLAIGGVSVILVELHRVIVLSGGWLTETQFTTLFALAQAAPGPNMMFITLIGWQMAGVGGALAATAAFLTPAIIVAGLVARLWKAWEHRGWFLLLRRGLVPLTVGLLVASAWLLTNAAASGVVSYVITAAATAVALFTRTHPVLILLVAAIVGIAGLV
jgi:chromate transporter